MRYVQLTVLTSLATPPLANFATQLTPPWHGIRERANGDTLPSRPCPRSTSFKELSVAISCGSSFCEFFPYKLLSLHVPHKTSVKFPEHGFWFGFGLTAIVLTLFSPCPRITGSSTTDNYPSGSLDCTFIFKDLILFRAFCEVKSKVWVYSNILHQDASRSRIIGKCRVSGPSFKIEILPQYLHLTMRCTIKSQLPSYALSLPVISTPCTSPFPALPIMRYFQLSMLCILTAAPLHNIAAKPIAPHWDHLRVKHSWNNVPPNWESLGHPPAGTTIDLNIVLMSYNENALIDALYEVSDPKSVKYGKHLSKEQVNRLIAPHQDTLDLVHSWLGHHNIPPSSVSMTRGGSLLTLTGMPVSRANGLLGASYQLYRNTGTNDTAILRTVGYSLPTVLHAHVQTVMPTTYFSTHTSSETPLKHHVNSTATMESREVVRMLSIRDTSNKVVTPSSLRDLYRTISYVPTEIDKNVLAITAFLNQYPSLEDFDQFMARCRSDAVNPPALATFTHVEVNGGEFNPSNPGTAANANMQYTAGLAYPTPIHFYSVGGNTMVIEDTNEPAQGDMMFEWLLLLLKQKKVPQTITMSYGAFEQSIPLEYGTTICNMFGELGARGATVLVASGNNGVGPENCLDSSGRLHFMIEFPTSCPYVTSVGGTMGQEFRAEVAASFSGGGFSNLFPRPDYQDDAVTTFLQKEGNRYNSFYSVKGRGIPDISAQAINYYIIFKNTPFLASGTNCAAPTVAGIISLLNDYRISTGRTPFGFLNPWLYGHGIKGLYDVVSGNNPGCGTEGFSAVEKWDPVTGLGTPDFLLLQYTLDHIPVDETG